ncbi:7205_t:CDS:2, partial [Gigaspora rosea]
IPAKTPTKAPTKKIPAKNQGSGYCSSEPIEITITVVIVIGFLVVALAITSLVMIAHLWQLLNPVKITIDDT